MKNKYNANKVITDKGTFDSKKELRRFAILQAMEKDGLIKDLRRQVKYSLIPAQYEPDVMITKGPHKGELKRGKLIERACDYVADFVYEINGQTVVEDTKSKVTRTPAYVIKRKLMLKIYGIQIKEV